MLNRLLRAQAASVVEFGGDIDKFVGDELMAIFTGDGADKRAVLCAIDMLGAVAAARRTGETLSVGIGISSGDVIYGAVGHEERMDFTVIGDVVNIGARLCSVAGQDEILVSQTVREQAGEHPDVEFAPGEPLALKGKSEPVPVFRARRKE
jgi:adenylate cyclase